jgi:hypothetical protein
MSNPKPDTPKRDREKESPDSEIKQRNKVIKMPESSTIAAELEVIKKLIVESNKQTTEKIEKLINQNAETFKKELSALEIRINDIEQNINNSSSFMVHNLPKPVLMSNMQLVNKALTGLGLQLKEDDIKRLQVIPYKSGIGVFAIVSLWNEKKKFDLMKRAKEKAKSDPVGVKEVFQVDPLSALYTKNVTFRTLLTRERAELYKKVQAYRNKPFKYVWENNGRILVKEKDDSRAIEIKSLAQIQEMTAASE